MARVLITGSSDGLGLMAAELLVDEGHAVTLHARNEQRGADARRALPAAEHVVDRGFGEHRRDAPGGRTGQCARPL